MRLWLQWVHNTGPIMTYMGACDGSTCDKFNGSTAKWFKIDQLGKKTDGSWYQQDVSAWSSFSNSSCSQYTNILSGVKIRQ
jgi:Auxiliary Activity family 9 (formerly GH61)